MGRFDTESLSDATDTLNSQVDWMVGNLVGLVDENTTFSVSSNAAR